VLIHEAVKKALETKGCIIRESIAVYKILAIMPTNTGFNCIVIGRRGKEVPNWNPSAEVLMATDWKVVSKDEFERIQLLRN